MRKPFRTRRLIALLAAYVVALEALLLPLTVATVNGSLCSATASAESGHQPARHDAGCACAAGCGMQCGAQALANPPPTAVALGQTSFSVIAVAPAIEAVIRPAHRSPQVARAPPLA
jgi:hypothetical protein